jgi:tetratricopeptide (TPR) repeat protein
VATIFAGVAEALDLAHAEGVVHRDIKPSNLLLDLDGVLKIVDFGLALQEQADGPSMTLTGDLLGTPAYMSPEQAMAKRIKVDHRTDVYSLGATLYEVLTLRPPFRGDNLHELCSQIITKDPALPRRSNRRIPRDLETIVCKAMEKDRDKRYQSAGEFARDLRRFGEGAVIRARRIGLPGRTWRRVKRHKLKCALALAVVILASAGGVLTWRAARASERWRQTEYVRLVADAQSALGASMAQIGSTVDLLASAIELVPERPEALAIRALVAGGTLEEGLADLTAARDRGLLPSTYHLSRAYLFRLHRRPGEAGVEETRAGGQEPATAAEAYFRGCLRAAEGNRADSLRLLDRAVRDAAPGSAIQYLALRYRAGLRQSQGDLSGAMEDLHALQALGDSGPRVGVRIASLWRGMDKERIANAQFEEARNHARNAGTATAWEDLSRAAAATDEYDWLDQATEEGLRAHGDSLALILYRALALLRKGANEEALEFCARVIEQSPDLHTVYEYRAEALEGLGQHERALEAFDRALELDPACSIAHGRRGVLLLNHMRRYAEALESFDRKIRLDPGRAKPHYNRGVALLYLGDFERALESFECALSLDPEHARSHAQMGFALARLGRPVDALASCDRALRLEPESAEFFRTRGFILTTAGRLDDALAAFDRSIELNPAFAAAHGGKGDVLRLLGRMEEALAAYDAAVRHGLENAKVHICRGFVLSALGRPEAALEAYTEATLLAPSFALAFQNRGATLQKLGRLPEALQAFDEALLLDPSSALAHANRGIVLGLLGRPDDALKAHDRALAIDGRLAGTHVNRARVLGRLRRWSESLAAYDHALELELGTGRSAILNESAWLRATCADSRLRDADRAVTDAREALKLSPGNAAVWNTLGVALYRRHDWRGALEALERSMMLQAGGGVTDWFFVAMAHAKLEHPKPVARSFYDMAVDWMEEHKPDDEELNRFRAEAEEVLGIAEE